MQKASTSTSRTECCISPTITRDWMLDSYSLTGIEAQKPITTRLVFGVNIGGPLNSPRSLTGETNGFFSAGGTDRAGARRTMRFFDGGNGASRRQFFSGDV